jgi:hypothetical protein
MTFCNAECIHSKLLSEGEPVCCIEPVLSCRVTNRLICADFKERSGPAEERYPGMNTDGLFPGQIGYKEK